MASGHRRAGLRPDALRLHPELLGAGKESGVGRHV